MQNVYQKIYINADRTVHHVDLNTLYYSDYNEILLITPDPGPIYIKFKIDDNIEFNNIMMPSMGPLSQRTETVDNDEWLVYYFHIPSSWLSRIAKNRSTSINIYFSIYRNGDNGEVFIGNTGPTTIAIEETYITTPPIIDDDLTVNILANGIQDNTTSINDLERIVIGNLNGDVTLSDAYYTKNDIDVLISSKADLTHNHDGVYKPFSYIPDWSEILNKPTTFKPEFHHHDDRYYTETEMDTALLNKADLTHNHDGVYEQYGKLHDDRYYTETEMDEKITTLDNKISAVVNHIDRKEAVETYDHLNMLYLNPEDGWTVWVKDEDVTYTYNGTEWVSTGGEVPLATYTIDGKMSSVDKIKIDGIEDNANNYTHPITHPATMITEDTTHRFMTDTERNKLSAIEDSANNYVHPTSHSATMIDESTYRIFFTPIERNKLSTIANNANNYTHPDTHPATMITEDTTHRFITDTERITWDGKQDPLTFTGDGVTVTGDTVDIVYKDINYNPVSQTITELNTSTAPSEDAVYNALLNKSDVGHTHDNYISGDGDSTINGNLTVTQNLNILGDTTTINSTETEIFDRIITLNKNDLTTLPSGLISGLVIDRNILADYGLIYKETDNTFRIGEYSEANSIDYTQALATREDSPINNGVAVWDSTDNMFKTTNTLNELTVNGDITIGTYLPRYYTDDTTPYGDNAPITPVNIIDIKNRATFNTIKALAGEGDYLYCADRQPNITLTASGGRIAAGRSSDPYTLFDGALNTNFSFGTPTEILANPAILTIENNTTWTATDVLTLQFFTHVLSDHYTYFTSWKVEVKGQDDIWDTVLDRSNVMDQMNKATIPLHISGLNSPYTNYQYIKGIRITVRDAVSNGYMEYNGEKEVILAAVQLRDARPSMTPAEGVGALDIRGGNMYGDTDWLYGKPKVNGSDVILEGDSRLSDSRPASDVYSWAKASERPTYSWDDITTKPTTFTPSEHDHNEIKVNDVRYMTVNTTNSSSYDPTTTEIGDNNVNAFFSQAYPGSGWRSALTVKGWSGSYGAWQISGTADTTADEGLYFRTGSSDTWGTWREIYHEGHKPTLDELGAMGSTLLNGYNGITTPTGSTSDWVRTTVNGIIPYESGGSSSLGTSSWPFTNIYGMNIYQGGNRVSVEGHHHDYLSTLGGTLDGGVNTTLNIISDDTGESVINLYGSSQGTGRVFVGQSPTFGGGIEYNGNNDPVSSGAGADQITLYRVSSGASYWTAKNSVNSNDWIFRGDVYSNISDKLATESYVNTALNGKWDLIKNRPTSTSFTLIANGSNLGTLDTGTTLNTGDTLMIEVSTSAYLTATSTSNCIIVTLGNDDTLPTYTTQGVSFSGHSTATAFGIHNFDISHTGSTLYFYNMHRFKNYSSVASIETYSLYVGKVWRLKQ